jgi:hypothetical protein
VAIVLVPSLAATARASVGTVPGFIPPGGSSTERLAGEDLARSQRERLSQADEAWLKNASRERRILSLGGLNSSVSDFGGSDAGMVMVSVPVFAFSGTA